MWLYIDIYNSTLNYLLSQVWLSLSFTWLCLVHCQSSFKVLKWFKHIELKHLYIIIDAWYICIYKYVQIFGSFAALFRTMNWNFHIFYTPNDVIFHIFNSFCSQLKLLQFLTLTVIVFQCLLSLSLLSFCQNPFPTWAWIPSWELGVALFQLLLSFVLAHLTAVCLSTQFDCSLLIDSGFSSFCIVFFSFFLEFFFVLFCFFSLALDLHLLRSAVLR